jgi:subfamily B ATP-binding cassette protein MsbA
LYAAGGRYFELYTKQHGLESNLFLAPGEGNGESAEIADSNGTAPGAAASDTAALPEAIRLIRGNAGS